MPRWLWTLLLLPFLDLFSLSVLGRVLGLGMWIWLGAAFFGGIWFLKQQKTFIGINLRQLAVLREMSWKDMLWSVRGIAIGLLLMFPGAASDVLALWLFFLKAPSLPQARPPHTPEEGVIEGQWREIQPERPPLEKGKH